MSSFSLTGKTNRERHKWIKSAAFTEKVPPMWKHGWDQDILKKLINFKLHTTKRRIQMTLKSVVLERKMENVGTKLFFLCLYLYFHLLPIYSINSHFAIQLCLTWLAKSLSLFCSGYKNYSTSKVWQESKCHSQATNWIKLRKYCSLYQILVGCQSVVLL